MLGDLNSRRGQVLGTDTDADDMTVVSALVPTAEIVRYAIDLRSMSGGTGTFEAKHHGYQPLPPNLVDQLKVAHHDD